MSAIATKGPTFRMKFRDPDGIWWTAPMSDWVDVCLLMQSLRSASCCADVFVNDRDLTAEVDAYFAGALAQQKATGQPQVGAMTSGCQCPKCTSQRPPYAIVRVPSSKTFEESIGPPIVGGFPLLDQEPRESATDERGSRQKPPSVSVSSAQSAAPPSAAIHPWSTVAPAPPFPSGADALRALWAALVALGQVLLLMLVPSLADVPPGKEPAL